MSPPSITVVSGFILSDIEVANTVSCFTGKLFKPFN